MSQKPYSFKKGLSNGQPLSEIVQSYLNKIAERNASINAFLEVFDQDSLSRAAQLDRKAEGQKGRLFGAVIGIKDNICYKNHKVSAGSKILENYTSPYSATAVKRLLDEDAIIIGRLNCDEFAMGSSNENSAFGPTLNPHDNTRVPGGSSGGAAAAVTAGMCNMAIGSSTGGSIRQPASFCGNVGFKPTYGRISRFGLLAYGSSLDQIGSITNSVEDAALLLEIMAGPDEYDATAIHDPLSKPEKIEVGDKKYKIAYYKSALDHNALDDDVKHRSYEIIDQLREDGHTVEPVSFNLLDFLVPTYYIISTAEASTNLSRYDGAHFGYRSSDIEDLSTMYKKSRSEAFGTEVKRRIMLGTFVLSAGHYDAYYTKAQKVRRLLHDATTAVLRKYDFIFSPTTPSVAFKLNQKTKDPVAMYLEDIFTVQANLCGMPCISLPLGWHKGFNMPFGLQFMANRNQDMELLVFAKNVLSIFEPTNTPTY